MEENKEQMKGRAINIYAFSFPMENFITTVSVEEEAILHNYRWPGVESEKGNPPKAVIIFCHGYGSNVNSHAYIAKLFAEQNYDFVGYDQKGFGKSEGVKGLILDKENFQTDCTNFVIKTREYYSQLYPDKAIPFIPIGYSLGAQCVVGSSKQLKDLKMPGYDAMMFIAPAFKGNREDWSEEKQIEVDELSKKDPLSIVPFPVFVPLLDISYLIVYPDTLFYLGPSYARTINSIYLSDKEWEHIEQISCPVHIATADQDKNVNSDEIQRFWNTIKTPVELKVQREFHADHPLLNDGWVYEDIVKCWLEWLNSVVIDLTKDSKQL